MVLLQPGQGPFLPANLSLTWNRLKQFGQVTWIGMKQNQEKQEPCHGKGDSIATLPSAHVVLYQPEIPGNTGNIGRTCVAVGAKLWIVHPAGFQLDEKHVRRAGLDYWKHLMIEEVVNWDALTEKLSPRRFFYFSRFATKTIWDANFQKDDVFVFGSESSGLPESILDRDAPNALRIPTTGKVRSLNLATTAGIVLYEHQRQVRSLGE